MNRTWPPGRPRVLVTDAWLANAGDGAIALATDRMIRQLAPDASVLHAAYQGELLEGAYAELSLVPPVATLLGVDGAAPFDGWDADAGARLVDGADLVVSQGGGFLLEHYQPWERLFALAGIVDRDRPLVLLGQSIGPFRLARARSLLHHILSSATAVVVRDEPSFIGALDLGARPDRLSLASDVSLTLFADVVPVPRARDGVAVVLTTHPESPGREDEAEALSRTVLEETIVGLGDERVTLLSTAQGLDDHGFEDDARVAISARDALIEPLRARVDLVDGYVGPRAVIEILGRHRAVVSQRFHPALFALAQGVPAALLLANDKIGALASADLGSLVCTRPEDPIARGAALRTALDPGARAGQDLVDALLPATRAAQRIATVLQKVLGRLDVPVSSPDGT